MRYEKIKKAVFLERENRFVAKVLLDGCETATHVKNTGRCKELLVKGATVYLSFPDNEKRKIPSDLVAVEKERVGKSPLLINMDSSAPNAAVSEWLPTSGLFSENAVFRREVTKGNSRFDFAIEDNGALTYLEVKGVTLEEDGVLMFPDAPTERGVKHLRELSDLRGQGFGAAVLFVIQMKGAKYFTPNRRTHKEFAEALMLAEKSGVKVLAYDAVVTENEMKIDLPVEVRLESSR